MTDYSQLLYLNPVARCHEEPWLPLPSWQTVLLKGVTLVVIFWSWLNAAVVALCLGEHYESLWHPGSHCGSGPTTFDFVMKLSPILIALNLAFWLFIAKQFPHRVWRVKLPTLLAVILWCGVVGGIMVGKELPDWELEQAQARRLR